MVTFTSTELNVWIASFLWPLTRILGLVATAPVFGNLSIPVRVKLGLGIMLSILVGPTVPALPAADPMSFAGLLIVLQQLVIGLAMGFAMRLVFAAVEMAGEICGLTMGFGFATFFDPQTRARSSAIAQFLALLTLMLFLATNVHLVMLSTLAESFVAIPITAQPTGTGGFHQLVKWGGIIFSSGVQLALPMIAALLLINIALGILTRAAPQLNLFGIGFPVTLAVGFLVLALILPYLAVPMQKLFEEGNVFMQQMLVSHQGKR
ncbi:flagellar biosynthetic protein FliR [Noviherbaspirillum malthae]|uniref:flagellar biosynthetic protein FliR n=1 Tax=Noviherbaspirillum malthae TaxID=1260987 RepID=UPI00188F5922|nr:flagellar biosynthetic protein FliR [Noviherbaspirillum malthae]